MNQIVDFHVHVFPDALAARAIAHLEHGGHVKAALDGRVSSLLASMDEAGIAQAVVCSIATKPDQFAPILKFSQDIASPRIVPLASIHPKADPDPVGRVHQVAEAGLVGIKVHPYYQDFELDDPALDPFYRALDEAGLIVVSHTGFDFAFPRQRKGDPIRVRRLLDRFPTLKLVTTHIGAWDDWDEVDRHLIGQPVWMEISLSIELLGRERAREMLLRHPADRVLFGTDSPWTSQSATLALVRSLNLGPEREAALLGDNARRFLRPA